MLMIPINNKLYILKIKNMDSNQKLNDRRDIENDNDLKIQEKINQYTKHRHT